MFPGALGDLLLLAPAVTTLVARGHAVELSVSRALEALARAVLRCPLGPPADGRVMSSLFGELVPELARWWRGAGRLEVWLGDAASAHVARHAGALGIRSARTHRVERDDRPWHASLAYAAALAVDPPLAVPRLQCDAETSETPWTVPAERRLVIHPGAGDARKRWERRGFVSVAHAWRRHGGEAVVLLGPSEDDEAAAWRATDLEVVTGLDLMRTATLLARGRTFLGNDSGISHLAGVVGCRGVVLFGPTSPQRWRPLGGSLAVVEYARRTHADVVDAVLRALSDGRLP